ncbi:Transcriptional regulator LytR [Streptomyces lavendulae subsp. lavendulae]|uniref:Transcriptional regulator LytR n=1 Tax=Streptomyces lavendulae subsp. lavendulae TaxID=58340 RepID=A0A2K8PGU3_STRLA|nr:LCP family protein [Streptomyces lavendulae]ATZ24983.1 Transcriptional regulator LytR [Streptomyces lavendulae subsp. lavendulae]QUQ54814.1 Polyisoprenyl-teichoic acid--peptidoglycan teichoic acid transferase TagU [Streptomyces lavendulae subsp. lavendulae]
MSAHRRKTSRRRPSPRRIGRTLLITGCALTVMAGGTAWYLYRDLASSIGSSKALEGAERSAHGDLNILLIGLDSRRDQNGDPLPEAVLDQLHAGSSDIGGYNANTMILLHVPGDGSRAKAFSIPRDDFVDLSGVPGHGKDKIKKAYGLAKAAKEDQLTAQGVNDRRRLEHEGREAGRKAQIDTVRSFLGVPVDHFAELNLAGFYHLADALDGVPVCLRKPVKDKYSGADFPAGRQTLNGKESLAFVRQRHGLEMGDLDRTKRQQAFLAGATQKLNSAGTFTDPAKLLKLIDTAKQDVVTDAGWDLLAFVKQAKNLSGGKVQFTTLPVEGFGRNHGEDINVVDDMKIKRLIAEQIGPQATASPSAPGAASSAPSPPPPSPSSSPAASPSAPPSSGERPGTIDGGGIPCVD